MYSKVI